MARRLALAVLVLALVLANPFVSALSSSLRGLDGKQQIGRDVSRGADTSKLEPGVTVQSGNDLRSRVKTLQAQTAVLIEDAKQLSDKTKELSERANRLINSAATGSNSQHHSRRQLASSHHYNDQYQQQPNLRGSCSSRECGVRCMKDCKAQCTIVKLLGLEENHSTSSLCNTTLCAKICARGCLREPCTFRFVLN